MLEGFKSLIVESLEDLGWFEPTIYDEGATPGWRQHHPLTVADEPVDWDTPIEPNMIAFSIDNSSDEQFEMGSRLTEDRHILYVDVYAEDDEIGYHLAHDVKDICRGKYFTIGADRTGFDLLNLDEATPSVLGFIDIEDVVVDRPRNFPQAWLRHWFTLKVIVNDYVDHDDEDDDDIDELSFCDFALPDFGALTVEQWTLCNDVAVMDGEIVYINPFEETPPP